MNLNFQFQMEDNRLKLNQSMKDKSSANTMIVIGSISLSIAIILGSLGLLASMGALLPSTTSFSSSPESIWGSIGCCFSLAFIFLVPGVILLWLGIIRRKNAVQEIRSAEEEMTLIRRQILINEQEKK